MKRRSVSVGLLAVVFFGCGQAMADTVFQGRGFSLTLPEGVREIPSAALKANSDALKQIAPDAPRQFNDYGFQLTDTEQWFTYPYVLIQVLNVGRIPEEQLTHIAQLPIDRLLAEREENLHEVLANLEVATPVYDAEHRIIWFALETEVAGIGTVSGLSASIPTQVGMIQISGYARKEHFAEVEARIRKLILSATVAPELVYRPVEPPVPERKVGVRLIIGLMVGLVVIGFVVVRMKSR